VPIDLSKSFRAVVGSDFPAFRSQILPCLRVTKTSS